jgi:Zn-dependent protease with chaperone function
MDFFEAQEHAKRRTVLLVGLFAAAVVAIIVSVYLVLTVAGGMTMGTEPGFDPGLFILVAIGTSLLIAGGSGFRTAQLRKGGSAVAELLGGRRVDPATRDPDERRLVNVVEEMAVASGTPVPAIFVMDREASINAFAAGYGIHDAAVAVTRGTLEQLNRDELQGVIAHEFSHILNGDMRLNIRLMGILFGILLLAIVGRGILRGGMMSGRRQRDNRAAMLGLALVLLGYIGVFFIKAAVSRQREYLADAAAVQFTRNPGGIAGALQKIGAHASGGKVENHHAEESSHFFFANGVGSALSRVTATHPPLDERIRRIDPSWDGTFEPTSARARVGEERSGARAPGTPGARGASTAAAAAAGASGRPGAAGASGSGAGGPGLGMAAAAVLMGSVGAPAPEHVDYARALLGRIPDELRAASHDPEGATALVLALLGGDDERSRAARRSAARSLEAHAPGLAARVEALEPPVAELAPEARLPLVDLALPSLGDAPGETGPELRRAAEQVVRADGTTRVFDFALMHILRRHLAVDDAGGGARRGGGVRSLDSARRELGVLLSAVARSGSDGDEATAELAFREGTGAVGRAGTGLVLLGEGAVTFDEVDRALDRLERAGLDVRRRVLHACAAAVLADRAVRTAEVELLRAVAECLELPLPPLLDTRAEAPA